jgi:hypothetical protein
MVYETSVISWVDTGAIGYPALHKKILELTMPNLVVKKLFPEFPLVAGKSVSLECEPCQTATFVKQSGSRAAAITEVSEGAESGEACISQWITLRTHKSRLHRTKRVNVSG